MGSDFNCIAFASVENMVIRYVLIAEWLYYAALKKDKQHVISSLKRKTWKNLKGSH